MTTRDIKALVESFDLPYAYHQFADDTWQNPPFVCFFYGNRDDFIADDSNYSKIVQLYIELYTDEKDFALESVIEEKLSEAGIVYTAEDAYIDTERMHVTVYTTEICLEV